MFLAALLLLWHYRPAAAWSLSVRASDSEVPPWTSVDLTADVAPKDAPRNPLRWTWRADDVEFSHGGPTTTWRTGTEGTHRIEVVATAANGAVQVARTEITVTHPGSTLSVPLAAAQSPAPRADAGPPLPFEITDVWVEKRSVCLGEATRVRLTVHDARGAERWLRPSIAGVNAWEISYVAPIGAEGLQPIHVSVIDDLLHRARLDSDAYVQVNDCAVPYPVFVEQKPMPPDADSIAFMAVALRGSDLGPWMRATGEQRGPAPRADVSRYEWDFGDGAHASSKDGRMSHRFPSQADRGDELQTAYPVKVTAFDGSGQELGTGYTTVALKNPLRDLKRNLGVLQLIATVPPGPAATGDDGSRYVDVTLRNIDGTETAHLSGLKATFVDCEGRETTERSLSPGSVFSDDSVSPGAAVSGRLTISADDAKSACSVGVQATGSSSPHELRVTAAFALDPGNRKGRRVTAQQASVLGQARSLLGNPQVITMADLQRLEDEGKIPRGVVVPNPFPSTTAPSSVPAARPAN